MKKVRGQFRLSHPGNAYPAGAATSLTLNGLSEGTEFNVQVRARYHDGEHEDSPWSGPWAEARALVMSQPPDVPSAPAAPNLVGTALTPEGHVMLVWLSPSDDSITGYQVLRGPDAGDRTPFARPPLMRVQPVA